MLRLTIHNDICIMPESYYVQYRLIGLLVGVCCWPDALAAPVAVGADYPERYDGRRLGEL